MKFAMLDRLALWLVQHVVFLIVLFCISVGLPYKPLSIYYDLSLSMKTPKPLFAGSFAAISWLVEVFLSVWAWVQGATDWSLFGSALAGSTVFVVHEAITSKKKRGGWERFGIIAMGVTVSLFSVSYVSKKYELEGTFGAFVVGALTYKVLGKLFKEKDDETIDETIDELKDLTP